MTTVDGAVSYEQSPVHFISDFALRCEMKAESHKMVPGSR